jgi:hypothetical protein
VAAGVRVDWAETASPTEPSMADTRASDGSSVVKRKKARCVLVASLNQRVCAAGSAAPPCTQVGAEEGRHECT